MLREMIKSTCLLALMAASASAFAHAHEHGAEPHSAPFILNKGQWNGGFLYKAEVGPLALFMGADGLTWSLLQPDFAEVIHEAGHRSDDAPVLKGHAWRVRFEGASRPQLEPMHQAGHANNYFLGNDPQRWQSNVPLFEEVAYRGIWPGVDMRMYLHAGHFKYDILLAPGADARAIGLRYDGLTDLRIDGQGRLVFKTSVGEVVEEAPVAWYGDAPSERVECRYVLKGSVLGFEVIGADHSRAIVIDPTLIAATLSGSTSTNYGHCATYDSEGNIYTGAISFGQGYPTGTGSFQSAYGGGNTDIAVSKLTPDGTTLIYATYVGGNAGEYPHSLMVDNDFNLWVYGTTDASNYPVTPGVVGPTMGGLVDIVVTKVGPTGASLVGSTFIGGNGNDGRNGLVGGGYEQYRGEIVVDAQGNAYIASCTESNDFPVSTDAFQPALAGAQDGVVFSLDPTLTQLRFSTHLGGSNDDMAYGLKVRQDGVVVVSGGTGSANFPVTTGVLQPTNAGGNDAFVTMLAPTGSSLVASTFWGTSSGNVAYFIELDLAENVYIYGVAQGGVPIEPAGTYGIPGGGNFLAEFNADLTSVVFTSCIGPGSVAPVAFLVDLCNNIYISGYQAGSGLPVTSDALYTSGVFYIGVFQPHMAGLLYGTYYTGANHVDGGTSRFDKNGVIYQGVCTSGGLPLTPNAYGTTQSSWDIGVFKIDMEQAGVQANVSVSSSYGCVPATLTFNAQGNAPNYIWDMGDGSPTLTGSSVTHTYTVAGTYTIMLIGWDSTSCNSSDTAYTDINILDPAQLNPSFDAVPLSSCDGYGVQLTNTSVGGTSISWAFGDGGTSTQQAPFHSYALPGIYEVVLTVTDGLCNATGTLAQTIEIPPATIEYVLASPVPLCPGGTAALNGGGGYDSYDWSTGEQAQIITVNEVGVYSITVTDGLCTGSSSIEVVAIPLPAPLADQRVCAGDEVTLSPGVPVSQILWSTGSSQVSIPGEEGTYWFVAVDANGCTFRDTVDVVRIPPTDGINFIPNVFTPNGDGLNDEFKVDAPGLKQFSMEVFNRWGQSVFASTSVDRGWRGGLDNGSSAVPDGTYFYIISFKDECSNEPEGTRTGHVTLLR